MQLYSYFRSSAAYRVRIALNVKGLEYQQRAVNLVTGEQRDRAYRAKNPQGLVPALELADGSVISQSGAILDWLEDQYPHNPLYPASSLERARARSFCQIIACDIHPLNNLRVLKYLSEEIGVSEQQKTTWYQHWIAEGFSALEGQLSGSPYALGTAVSMVDVYLVPQVFNALRYHQDMALYPKIWAIYEACNELDAFRNAAPAAQPDAR